MPSPFEVGERRRDEDLRPDRRARVVGVDPEVGLRVHRLDLGRVAQHDRPAGDGRAVGVPRVDVGVVRADDDLLAGRGRVDVADRRGGVDAPVTPVPPVADRTSGLVTDGRGLAVGIGRIDIVVAPAGAAGRDAHALAGRLLRQPVIDGRGEPVTQRAVGLEDVHAALEVADRHLQGPVAVEVLRGERAEQHRPVDLGGHVAPGERVVHGVLAVAGQVPRHRRELADVDGPARQLLTRRDVGERVDHAVGGGEQHLVDPVTVEVVVARRPGAAGVAAERPGVEPVGDTDAGVVHRPGRVPGDRHTEVVADGVLGRRVDVDLLLVDGLVVHVVGRVDRVRDDAQPQPHRVALGLELGGRVLAGRPRRRAVGDRVAQRCRGHTAELAVHRVGQALVVGDRRPRPAGRLTGRVRARRARRGLDARRVLEDPVERPAGGGDAVRGGPPPDDDLIGCGGVVGQDERAVLTHPILAPPAGPGQVGLRRDAVLRRQRGRVADAVGPVARHVLLLAVHTDEPQQPRRVRPPVPGEVVPSLHGAVALGRRRGRAVVAGRGLRVGALGRLVAEVVAGAGRGEVDVVSRQPPQLHGLLRRQREAGLAAVVAHVRRHLPTVDGVAGRRLEQPGDPGGPARRLRRAGGRRDREVQVPAVVRAPVEVEVGLGLGGRQRRGADRVHRHRVVVGGGPHVVAGGLVRHRRVDDHPVLVGVVERRLRERGVVDRPERLLDHGHAVVGRVGDGLTEVVHVRDERVPDPQRHDRARRAGPVGEPGLAVGVLRLAGPVAVVDVVHRVVVVLEEVPPGDVVDVAVVIRVHPVGERADEILGIDLVVAVEVGHPRVGPVVGDVEHAVGVPVGCAVVVRVAVHVVAAEPGVVRVRAHVAVGVLRAGQLRAVEVVLAQQLGAGLLPADPGVEHGDRDVGTTGRHLPGLVQPHALDAIELLRVVRHRGVGGVAVVRELPVTDAVERRRQVVGGRRTLRAVAVVDPQLVRVVVLVAAGRGGERHVGVGRRRGERDGRGQHEAGGQHATQTST